MSLKIGIGSLKIASLTTEGETIIGTFNDLLDGEGNKESHLFTITSSEGIDSGEGIATTTSTLEANFSTDHRPIYLDVGTRVGFTGGTRKHPPYS